MLKNKSNQITQIITSTLFIFPYKFLLIGFLFDLLIHFNHDYLIEYQEVGPYPECAPNLPKYALLPNLPNNLNDGVYVIEVL